MKKMLLVSMVDGTEVTPIRVVRSQLEARKAVIDDATQYLDDADPAYPPTVHLAVSAFDQAWADMNERLFELEGLQFESGVGSWDYLIQRVDVTE